MKKLAIAALALFSVSTFANEYCGKVYKFSYDYDGIYSLRFVSNTTQDDPSTEVNEKFATLTGGQDAFELILDVVGVSHYSNYGTDAKQYGINVCFKNFDYVVKNYTGGKYGFIENVQDIQISAKTLDDVYSGSVETGVKFYRLTNEKAGLEKKIKQMQQRVKEIDRELSVLF